MTKINMLKAIYMILAIGVLLAYATGGMVRMGVCQRRQQFAARHAIYLYRISWRKMMLNLTFACADVRHGRQA